MTPDPLELVKEPCFSRGTSKVCGVSRLRKFGISTARANRFGRVAVRVRAARIEDLDRLLRNSPESPRSPAPSSPGAPKGPRSDSWGDR